MMDAKPLQLALALAVQLPNQRKQESEQEVSFFKIVFGLSTHKYEAEPEISTINNAMKW